MAPGTLIFRFLSKKNQFWSFHQKISKFFSFQKFEVNFSVFAPGPQFFRFYLQIFKFLIFHQKFLDISKYILFFGPGPLFFRFLHEKFHFFIFHQIGSKYLHFEKFPVNFGFLAPSPLFLGFFKIWMFHQNGSKYSSFEIFEVTFWILAPSPQFFRISPKKCKISNFN